MGPSSRLLLNQLSLSIRYTILKVREFANAAMSTSISARTTIRTDHVEPAPGQSDQFDRDSPPAGWEFRCCCRCQAVRHNSRQAAFHFRFNHLHSRRLVASPHPRHRAKTRCVRCVAAARRRSTNQPRAGREWQNTPSVTCRVCRGCAHR